MSLDVLAYPFLFTTIFFESFILVTFLSAPARLARRRGNPGKRASDVLLPSVTVIVPCLNEASTVGATVESLLALDYPSQKLSVILVDNGSTDGTAEVMRRYAKHPQVTMLIEEQRGKHYAMNAGLRATDAEIIGCLDADSFVEPDALKLLIPCFEKAEVAATTAAMSVHAPKTIVQHMQQAEYIFGITLRHALSAVNGLYVTPGPFSLYRHAAIKKVGNFRYGYQTEDMEMALRLQKAGYAIENSPRARVYTKSPRTIRALIQQRVRWTTGFLRNILGEYRGLIWNRNNEALGIVVLPIALLAIGSGILMFSASLLSTLLHFAHAYTLRTGIPIDYAYLPQTPQLDWFFFPSSFLIVLSGLTTLVTLSMIAVGKYLSKTPGSLTLGLISYLLLYGFIAPLWLMRSSADALLGTTRKWR